MPETELRTLRTESSHLQLAFEQEVLPGHQTVETLCWWCRLYVLELWNEKYVLQKSIENHFYSRSNVKCYCYLKSTVFAKEITRSLLVYWNYMTVIPCSHRVTLLLILPMVLEFSFLNFNTIAVIIIDLLTTATTNAYFIVGWGGGVGLCNFQSSFRGGSLSFVPNGRSGSRVFYPTHFQMLRPTPCTFWPDP